MGGEYKIYKNKFIICDSPKKNTVSWTIYKGNILSGRKSKLINFVLFLLHQKISLKLP